MLNVFHIAGLKYSRQRPKCNLKSDTNAKSFNQLKRLKSVGWSLFFISVIPYAIDTISDMILSMNYGYGALYQQTAKVGFANATSLIAAFFIPSVICLFIVYREHKIMRTFFTTIILLIVLATLIIGGRSNAVILLSLLIILYEYLVRPFSKKFIFLVFVAGFFFLQVLTYVAAVRSADDRSSIAQTIEMSNNPAAEAIIEMGWSQFCLVESMRIVPGIEDYRYGKSYLYAFTSIIPNMGFWPIHPAMIESNLGDWLTDTLGLNFGTGFSMCAEAWVNFGSWGFIIFYIWGAILGSLLGRIESTISTGNVALLAFLLIVFWFSLKIPRNSFLNLVRAVFYYAGPIFLYCNNYKLRGK